MKPIIFRSLSNKVKKMQQVYILAIVLAGLPK